MFPLRKVYKHNYYPPEPVEKLVTKGWHKADLHVHTLYSYDVVKAPWFHPEALYQKARSLGMKYITFTDHDTMKAYDVIGWQREGLVPGVEIRILDEKEVGHTIHVNVYELNKQQFRELENIATKAHSIELFLAYLRDAKLPHTYNHPFWAEPGEKPNYSVIPSLIELFPVVEYNMHRVRPKNVITLALADRYRKGVVATTDTHTGDVGRAFTLAKGETFREFFQAIADRQAFIVPRDLTVSLLAEEIEQWVDLMFHPDLQRAQARIRTGVRQLDRGLDAVMNGALRTRPVLKVVCESAGYAVSRSKLPVLWYIRTQHSLARQIKSELLEAGVSL